MAEYKITITVDEGQEKILKSEAIKREKTPEQLLEALSDSVTAQIDSWINGQIQNKLGALSPADALARLEYFDA